MDRRSFIAGSAAMGISSQVRLPGLQGQETRYQNGQSPWPICLDTFTIRPASLLEKVNIAAEAGYDALEPWDMELKAYEEEGGNLKELGKMIRDKGLFVPSMIGLWGCIPDTQEKFNSSLKGNQGTHAHGIRHRL